MNLRVPPSTGILCAALAVSVAASALYHNGQRIQSIRSVGRPDPAPATRTGDLMRPAPESGASGPPSSGSAVPGGWRAYFFVTPGCAPCQNLISDIQSGAYRDVPGELVLVVSGWWPFGSMDAYCQRYLSGLRGRCRVIPDEDAVWTKAVLGTAPALPSSLAVDASGRVRGFVKGNRADLPELLQGAIAGRSLPVSRPSGHTLPRHATLLDGTGDRVSLGELTGHGTSIVTLVSSGCPGCTVRMEELARVRQQPGLRVVFVRLDGPGARPLGAGDVGAGLPVYTVADSAARRTVRAMAGGSSVPRTLVFRDGAILLRETRVWMPAELATVLSACTSTAAASDRRRAEAAQPTAPLRGENRDDQTSK